MFCLVEGDESFIVHINIRKGKCFKCSLKLIKSFGISAVIHQYCNKISMSMEMSGLQD